MNARDFKPGIIHAAATFDQDQIWVTERADVLRVDQIHPDHARNILLFLLRNASRFRRVYEWQTFANDVLGAHPDDVAGIDPPDRGTTTIHDDTRWMLERKITRAVMARILGTDDIKQPRTERAFNDHTDSDHIWTHPDGSPR